MVDKSSLLASQLKRNRKKIRKVNINDKEIETNAVGLRSRKDGDLGQIGMRWWDWTKKCSLSLFFSLQFY